MPPVGFDPTISSGERPYTYVLDREATRGHWDRLVKWPLRTLKYVEVWSADYTEVSPTHSVAKVSDRSVASSWMLQDTCLSVH
jgi:hypothetical protein